MKKAYKTPVMEIVRFETEDIIRTSGDLDNNTLEVDPVSLGVNEDQDLSE